MTEMCPPKRGKSKKRINSLQGDLKVAKSEARRFKRESASHYAELQDAKHEITQLQKEKRKLEKDFEKVARSNFGAAVDAYSSPGMLRKHKPNG